MRQRGQDQQWEREFNERLAQKISSYWASQGHQIRSTGSNVGKFVAKYRTAPGCVKTDLINGMPAKGKTT